jgi:exodeoxyribonuclease VII small subunit
MLASSQLFGSPNTTNDHPSGENAARFLLLSLLRPPKGRPVPAFSEQNPLFDDALPSPTRESADGPGTFEVSLAELEKIVHELEEGELGLAESLARYEVGIKHLKHCYQVLQETERKIELVTGVLNDGTPIGQPLDEAKEGPPESLADSAGKRRTRRTKPSAE